MLRVECYSVRSVSFIRGLIIPVWPVLLILAIAAAAAVGIHFRWRRKYRELQQRQMQADMEEFQRRQQQIRQ